MHCVPRAFLGPSSDFDLMSPSVLCVECHSCVTALPSHWSFSHLDLPVHLAYVYLVYSFHPEPLLGFPFCHSGLP